MIVDENRKTITVQGRGAVNGDPDGKEFPWHPKPLNKLTGTTAGQINDSPSLVFFTGKYLCYSSSIAAASCMVPPSLDCPLMKKQLPMFKYCIV